MDTTEKIRVLIVDDHEVVLTGVATALSSRVDMVVIGTRRGEITLKARADRDTAEGMVFIPFAFAEAPANALTNPQLDPMGKIPEFKFCACRIEKIDQPAAKADAAE